MQDAIDRFLHQNQAEGVSATTVERYRDILAPLLRSLRRRGCRRIADVTPADLDAYMLALAERGMAKSSRVQVAALIRRLFQFLQDRGVIVRCPARTLPVPDNGDEDLPKAPLSQAEVESIIRHLPRASFIDLRNRCLVELLYSCALRVGELVALNLGDVDRRSGVLVVRLGKGGQNRILPLMDPVLAAINDWLAVRPQFIRGPDTGALFLNQRGGRLSDATVQRWLWLLGRSLGIALHPHLFRHSLAVHMLQNGADVREVQEILGHARLDTTKVYLRLVPGKLAEAYEKAMPQIAVGLRDSSVTT